MKTYMGILAVFGIHVCLKENLNAWRISCQMAARTPLDPGYYLAMYPMKERPTKTAGIMAQSYQYPVKGYPFFV
jgi:hypothetical protein